MSQEHLSSTFADQLIDWYHVNPRDLPWKETTDPYRIWLSEIILQQTQVSQGIPYYKHFIAKYPTVQALASATEDEVLKDWQGLGYNSRARNLRRAAITVAEEMEGIFPGDYDGLLALDGVGPYTAAAIASFAFGRPVPVIDANVLRVMCRFLGIHEKPSSTSARGRMKAFLELAIMCSDPGEFNQAIMNFGALVCTPKRPSCEECPMQSQCYAFKLGLAEQLPVKTKKKPRRSRYFHYAVISDDSGLILTKRQLDDIWKGMYEMPLIEVGDDQLPEKSAITDLLAEVFDPQDLVRVGTHHEAQVLTHQKIHCTFHEYRAKNLDKTSLEAGYTFVPFKNLHTFAVPKVIDCYFKVKSIFL